jgi:hypothetical protein
MSADLLGVGDQNDNAYPVRILATGWAQVIRAVPRRAAQTLVKSVKEGSFAEACEAHERETPPTLASTPEKPLLSRSEATTRKRALQ